MRIRQSPLDTAEGSASNTVKARKILPRREMVGSACAMSSSPGSSPLTTPQEASIKICSMQMEGKVEQARDPSEDTLPRSKEEYDMVGAHIYTWIYR